MTPTPTPSPIAQIFSWTDAFADALPNIIRGLVVLLITLLIARFIKRWLVSLLLRGKVSLSVATLLGNLAQIGVVALGVVLMLPLFGVDTATLLTVLGVTGLAISLSLQDVLRNVVAGIYILLEQPFRIGDRITVKDASGTVQGIELRTTILWTDDYGSLWQVLDFQ